MYGALVRICKYIKSPQELEFWLMKEAGNGADPSEDSGKLLGPKP